MLTNGRHLGAKASPAPSRRTFLAQALTLSCGMGTMSCAARVRQSAATDAGRGQREAKLGVALLGLGEYASAQLAPALQRTRRCELRGVVTGTPAKAAAWRDKYALREDAVYDYTSLPRIAQNADIDVVYVVTPTALHPRFTIAAAEAGKHVWCEKPMALDVASCRKMIDACRANGVTLAIGYRLHHERNTQAVMRWAEERRYGTPRSVRALVGDPSDETPTWRLRPEMGGGALYDLGVYAINAIRYSTGEEPLRVVAARQWSERPGFRDVDEFVEFELALPSGARGFGTATRGKELNSLRVEAERGSYWLEPMQSYSGVRGATSDGHDLAPDPHVQQAQQMDDDALAILERHAPLAPGEEGLRDVRIIEAIQRAARTGAPVELRDEPA